MKSDLIFTQITRCFLAAAVCCLLGIIVSGQTKAEEKVKNRAFCQDYNYSNGDKVPFRETREFTVSAR